MTKLNFEINPLRTSLFMNISNRSSVQCDYFKHANRESIIREMKLGESSVIILYKENLCSTSTWRGQWKMKTKKTKIVTSLEIINYLFYEKQGKKGCHRAISTWNHKFIKIPYLKTSWTRKIFIYLSQKIFHFKKCFLRE